MMVSDEAIASLRIDAEGFDGVIIDVLDELAALREVADAADAMMERIAIGENGLPDTKEYEALGAALQTTTVYVTGHPTMKCFVDDESVAHTRVSLGKASHRCGTACAERCQLRPPAEALPALASAPARAVYIAESDPRQAEVAGPTGDAPAAERARVLAGADDGCTREFGPWVRDAGGGWMRRGEPASAAIQEPSAEAEVTT